LPNSWDLAGPAIFVALAAVESGGGASSEAGGIAITAVNEHCVVRISSKIFWMPAGFSLIIPQRIDDWTSS
jgi:hypothetical protein